MSSPPQTACEWMELFYQKMLDCAVNKPQDVIKATQQKENVCKMEKMEGNKTITDSQDEFAKALWDMSTTGSFDGRIFTSALCDYFPNFKFLAHTHVRTPFGSRVATLSQ